MTHGNTNDLGEAMLALVPVDGRTIGNKALREQLVVCIDRHVDEAEFFTTQQALVDAGTLVRGRGRGGSVKRAQAASDGALNLEIQEISAAAKQPESCMSTLRFVMFGVTKRRIKFAVLC